MVKEIKRILFCFSVFFILLTTVSLVSAQYYAYGINLGEGMQQILEQATLFLKPVFQIILGDYTGSDIFFAKVLLLILITIIISLILRRVPVFDGYEGIATLISIIVSIMSIRFISDNQIIEGIILPYSVFGVALTIIIPFLLFAYFIYATEMRSIGRKLSWIFFGIVFFFIWMSRYDDLGGKSGIINQIYLWTLIAIAIMLVFDRYIKAYFRGMEMKQFETRAHENDIINLQTELAILQRAHPDPDSRPPLVKAKMFRLKKQLKKLGGTFSNSRY